MDDDTLDVKINEFVAESRKMNGQVIHEREQWNSSVTATARVHGAFGLCRVGRAVSDSKWKS